ncbi:hypothetical protein DLREEDagrD3_22130 [Denitratisoma sp. agr-D3]
MASPPPNPSADDIPALASAWLARLDSRPAGSMPLETDAPADPVPLLAALCEQALAAGKTLWLLVADDQLLPELSNALDLAVRPLCLVLPEADFTARITLRASLALLKSRLNREVDEAWHTVWDGQKQRMAEQDALWRAALEWSAAERANSWPRGLVRLFPVRIAPVSRALDLEQGAGDGASPPADLVLVLEREPLPEAADALLAASQVLIFNPPPVREAFRGAIALSDKDLLLRGQVEMVSRDIAELELELATAKGELSEFSHRYHDTVGQRIAALDALQAELALRKAAQAPNDSGAKADAEEAKDRAEQSRQEDRRYRDAAREANEKTQFRPSADLKKLFRQVAQKIHPDRARNEADRRRRTDLMAEANRAYRSGDVATLQQVLLLWQQGQPTDSLGLADRNQLELQLERLKARLAEIQQELDSLYASRLYELFQAERIARKQKRNLLGELMDQIDLQIDLAKVHLRDLGWEEAAPGAAESATETAGNPS